MQNTFTNIHLKNARIPRVWLNLFQQQGYLVFIKLKDPLLVMRIAPLVNLLHVMHVKKPMVQLHHGCNNERLIQNKLNRTCRIVLLRK